MDAISTDTYPGVVNVTAPEPARFSEVCLELSRILDRPSWLKIPAPVLEIVLGEAAQLVLAGQRVIPKVLLDAGYSFQFRNLKAAFRGTFIPADKITRRR